MKNFIFLAMLYMHIIDDYVLQGVLAQMKCKSWWEKNYPDELYKNDYRTALRMHSFSWAFSVMLPIAIYYKFNIGIPFAIMLFANAIIHEFIDDLKANKKTMNLCVDQMVHVMQIVGTCTLLL